MPYLNKGHYVITGIIGSNCRNCNVYHGIQIIPVVGDQWVKLQKLQYEPQNLKLYQCWDHWVKLQKLQCVPLVGQIAKNCKFDQLDPTSFQKTCFFLSNFQSILQKNSILDLTVLTWHSNSCQVLHGFLLIGRRNWSI